MEETFTGEIAGFKENNENYQTLVVKDKQGNEYIVENGNEFVEVRNKFKLSEEIVVSKAQDINGENIYLATDYSRTDGLTFLFILFLLLVVFIGRLRGFMAVVGMGFSFLIIFKLILPMLLAGNNAVFTAILGSIIIIPVTFILAHGVNRKTFIAIISTVTTLIVTGILSIFFVRITYLTGFAAEESSFLLNIVGETLNFRGILLAGVIISTLGVLDDITISQASIVEELKSANKKLKDFEIFTKAMNVGKDHIASLVNTLVLVYTGASLPLLLLFTNSNLSFSQAINYEIIAEELVRMLIGSIGLVMAVPIATAFAVYLKYINLVKYKK